MQGLKGILLFVYVFVCLGGLAAQAPVWAWAVQAGGSELDRANSIATDADGNIYVAGSFMGASSFGSFTLTSSGYSDIFVIKLDSGGNILWAVKAGGTGDDSGSDVDLDSSGNVYLTGYYSGEASFGATALTSAGSTDVFAAKLNASGEFLWAVGAGSAESEYGHSLAVDNAANVYVTGSFMDLADFGSTRLYSNGLEDVFCAKLDSDGTYLWAINAGGEGVDDGRALDVDSSSNVYLTGLFEGTAAFGGFNLTSGGGTDVYAAKLGPNGDFVWVVKAGGIFYDESLAISVDAMANAYLTGSFDDTATFGSDTLVSSGFLDVFIAKLDPSGDFIWARQAGGMGFDIGFGIALDAAANAYLTGIFDVTAAFGAHSITSSGNIDIFAAKLDSDGDFIWANQAGGSGYDAGYGIALDEAANIYLAGFFDATSAFGPTNLTSNGVYDLYVASIRGDDPNVPVMLNSFSASISADNHVDLLWVTQSENSMLGFLLYRGITPNLDAAQLASALIPATNTSQQQGYTYLDTEVYSSGIYYYWLQSIELDGTTCVHGPISLPYSEPGYVPPYIFPQTGLGAVYPNPFNPTAFIPFEIAAPADVSLQICNSRGQTVYSVDLGSKERGHYRWEWNGRDQAGNECSNGIYLVVMSAGKEKFLRKAILCK